MTTPTDERPELLTVIVTMRAKPGQEEALRAVLVGLVEPTIRQAGSVTYDLHENLEDPAEFAFYENWERPEDLDAHVKSPHVKAFENRFDELLDGPQVVRRLRRIA